MKRGRPTVYKASTATAICRRLAHGESLRKICRSGGMPPIETVMTWVLDDREGFAAQYARAKNLQLDVMAEEVIELADKCRKGKKVETREIARHCSVCNKDARWTKKSWRHSEDGSALCETALAEKDVEVKTVEGDMVDRSRLQFDARRWYLSKLAPKRYGDKLEVDATVTTQTIADVLRERRRKRTEPAK